MNFSYKFLLLILFSVAGIPLLADAQIIKRKSKNDFKAPVIYTLHKPVSTHDTAAVKKVVQIDSNDVKKDSVQKAMLESLSAIQKDVSGIRKNQQTNNNIPQQKYYIRQDTIYFNDDTASLKYHDSVQLKDNVYQRQVDSLERRIEMLQKKRRNRDTLVIDERKKKIDSVKSVTIQSDDAVDTVQINQSLSNTQKSDSLIAMEDVIERNNDSIAVIQQSLQQAQDSANYYRRLAFASRSAGVAAVRADTVMKVDSVEKKKNWFQRTFKKKNNKDKNESPSTTQKNADTLKSQQTISASNGLLNDSSSTGMNQNIQAQPNTNNVNDLRARNEQDDEEKVKVERQNSSIAILRNREVQSDTNNVNDSGVRNERNEEERFKADKKSSSVVILQNREGKSDTSTNNVNDLGVSNEQDEEGRVKAEKQNSLDAIRVNSQAQSDTNNVNNVRLPNDGEYNERILAMDQRLNELKARNEMLSRNYDQLRSEVQVQQKLNNLRSNEPRREYNSYVSPYNNSYDAEISSLRREIQRIRDNAAFNIRPGINIPPSVTYITPPPATPIRDTVYMSPSPVQPPIQTDALADGENDEINDEIMEELKALRNQMDSLKRAYAISSDNTPKAPPVSFDPASYPIISLYFKMGAASFGKDQDNKIAPLAAVAKKNPSAILSLTAYTDPVGNAAINKKLANKRQQFVQQLLIEKYQIDHSRIMLDEPVLAKGSGKPNPMDRRVDVRFK